MKTKTKVAWVLSNAVWPLVLARDLALRPVIPPLMLTKPSKENKTNTHTNRHEKQPRGFLLSFELKKLKTNPNPFFFACFLSLLIVKTNLRWCLFSLGVTLLERVHSKRRERWREGAQRTKKRLEKRLKLLYLSSHRLCRGPPLLLGSGSFSQLLCPPSMLSSACDFQPEGERWREREGEREREREWGRETWHCTGFVF